MHSIQQLIISVTLSFPFTLIKKIIVGAVGHVRLWLACLLSISGAVASAALDSDDSE